MEFKNYESFKDALKKATEETFAVACEAYGREKLSGFALFSDESAMTMSVTINTFKHLKQVIKDDPGDDLYYKFTPDEWKETMFLSEKMDDLNEWLVEKNEELVGSELEEHCIKIFEMAVTILEELRKENLFAGTDDNFVVMFAISDFFDADYMIESFRRLNSPALQEEYDDYIQEQENYDDE